MCRKEGRTAQQLLIQMTPGKLDSDKTTLWSCFQIQLKMVLQMVLVQVLARLPQSDDTLREMLAPEALKANSSCSFGSLCIVFTNDTIEIDDEV